MYRGGANGDYQLPNTPNDTISSISWGDMNQQHHILIAGSWNTQVCMWMLDRNGNATSKGAINHDAPVLTTDLDNQNKIVYSGGCDNTIKAWDLNSGQSMAIGQHQAPVKSVRWIPSMNLLCSGSWDKTVRFWDIRTKQVAATTQLQDRVFSMDVRDEVACIAVGSRGIALYDARNPAVAVKEMVSVHEYQTRCVVVMPNKNGYAYGSVEGRVQIDYIGQKQQDSFPFRCHRGATNNVADIFSVTSLSFHPGYGTLATTGGDGIFSFWDHFSRNRLKQSNKMDNTISTACFSYDGSYYAYASSYDWSMGANSDYKTKPHQIYIHPVQDDSVRPKPPQQQQQQQQQQGYNQNYNKGYRR